MVTEKVEFDRATKGWFRHNPGAQTTVMKCERCGLYFKPSLGHAAKDCKLKGSYNNIELPPLPGE